ncbi:4,5-DOPA dioxygenase extradiol [Filimonas lacunae]|uniref:4,5-DOPA dioxygenase extradiol n=2 Tax=Filimonas lacunae TaxID=477680 RepID=A0A1N7Q0E0_9BACT|nr:4,5-DOPA dioxygenase extradiol [Filimonas lacunae]
MPLLQFNKGLTQWLATGASLPYTDALPVFFVGHQDFSRTPHITPFTSNLRAMGGAVKPAAILVISAHWLTMGDTYVNMNPQFKTVEYPVTGSPDAARLVMNAVDAKEESERELDHGAWSVLRHLSPDAAVPVLELSIDMEKPLDYHYNIARQLSSLRKRGVLIVGSGNVVHNLELSALKVWSRKPYEWAAEFDAWVKGRIIDRDISSLFQYYRLGKIADYAVPTMDHYIPMLYCLALCEKNEEIVFTYEEVIKGMSFRCFRIGAATMSESKA